MQNFEFHLPTRILFGPGSLKKLQKNVKGMGKKALIVIGKGSVKKHGYLDNVLSQLKSINVETVIFEGVESNPKAATIDRGAGLAREEKPRFVIGLGGGSVMDASKCIAMLAVTPGNIWDYAYKGINEDMKKFQNALPLVCIPTVAATSSETDRYAVVTNGDAKEKCTVFGDAFFPQFSIVDPQLTCSVPKKTTIDGAIDIITHVLEDFLSTNEETILQDRCSLAIVKTVMDYLPRVIDNLRDVEARTQLSWCSSIALSGFLSGRDGWWPIHSLEHVLSGHYDISHGSGLAALLPAIMRYDLPEVSEKLAMMGEYLFGINFAGMPVKAAAELSIEKFEDWMKSYNAFLPLGEMGITKDSLETMADDAIRLHGNIRNELPNIRPFSKADIIRLLEEIY
ncbi:iron-containing alcohol dehydrogenase [Candidatus Margulisiibacteriota bacterium]